MNIEKLHQFLIESNKFGYAEGSSENWIQEADKSTTIPYESGEWRSHDNFFGGEPYGGRMVVKHQEEGSWQPVWFMGYYGYVVEGVNSDLVYGVLRHALKLMPKDAPYRGPREYTEGDFVYSNSWSGELTRYSGDEGITQNGKLVYEAHYMGGLIDQKRGE